MYYCRNQNYIPDVREFHHWDKHINWKMVFDANKIENNDWLEMHNTRKIQIYNLREWERARGKKNVQTHDKTTIATRPDYPHVQLEKKYLRFQLFMCITFSTDKYFCEWASERVCVCVFPSVIWINPGHMALNSWWHAFNIWSRSAFQTTAFAVVTKIAVG